jgi:SAM-dependent methyltransferase
MHSSVISEPVQQGTATRLELLRRFLQAYWLRPENALWMALRSEALAQCPLENPSIDISCGDGVFSFLHCGGIFDPAFDVFCAVSDLDSVRDRHADMFDCVTDDYRPAITSSPGDTIDVGTDVKRSMLTKAGQLGLYERLVEHDNNCPLPFDDDSFQAVYCNSAYWVVQIDRFIGETKRITRTGGRIVLQVKLDSVHRYTLEKHRSVLGDRFLSIIDRGRTDAWPTIGDRRTWESRFAAAGLEVESATPFVTRTHAHIWDIGLRPIAPLLVKMARGLTQEARTAIKEEWVDLFCELLEPLYYPSLDLFADQSEPAEIQYILAPK